MYSAPLSGHLKGCMIVQIPASVMNLGQLLSWKWGICWVIIIMIPHHKHSAGTFLVPSVKIANQLCYVIWHLIVKLVWHIDIIHIAHCTVIAWQFYMESMKLCHHICGIADKSQRPLCDTQDVGLSLWLIYAIGFNQGMVQSFVGCSSNKLVCLCWILPMLPICCELRQLHHTV